MEMSNCVRCKKLFPKFKDTICESCKKKEEELFKIVKNFLDENPNSTIMKIAEETGVTHKKIMQWLRDGRLELSATNNELTCRNCGVDITSGLYCDPCHLQVIKQFGSVFGDVKKQQPMSVEQKRQSAAMHTRDRR